MANQVEDPPAPLAPVRSNTQPSSSALPVLPHSVVAPFELAFSFVGNLASTSTSYVTSHGTRATAKARPWLEFFDLSAFKLPEGGFPAYIERLKINGPFFIVNYILIGLALTVLSVITKPIALIGALVIVWLYFQFFGAENADQELKFMGFSLDYPEKLGLLVLLAGLVFWFTVGGVRIFFSVLTAIAFVFLLHGSFRKPPEDAIPIV